MTDPRKVRINRLRKAVTEANRFIANAREAIDYLEASSYLTGSAKVAAAKRSSMDLSRALADVRRNPYAEDGS